MIIDLEFGANSVDILYQGVPSRNFNYFYLKFQLLSLHVQVKIFVIGSFI